MAASNQSSLVPPIVLAVANQMNPDSLAAFRNPCSALVSHVLEALAVIDLGHFQSSCISPLGLLQLLVKAHCVVTVLGDLSTMFALGCHSKGPQHCLLCHVEQLLVLPGNSSKLSPTIFLWEAIFSSMSSTCDWVLFGNQAQGSCVT